MSIVYRIDQGKGVTLVLWDGVVTADEWLTHIRHLESEAAWPSAKRLHLADLRTASLDASMDEAALEKGADLYGQDPQKIANMKAAIVAGDAFQKAVTFERLIARYGASVIVFNSLGTACTWLNLNEGEVKDALQDLRLQFRDGRKQSSQQDDSAGEG